MVTTKFYGIAPEHTRRVRIPEFRVFTGAVFFPGPGKVGKEKL